MDTLVRKRLGRDCGRGGPLGSGCSWLHVYVLRTVRGSSGTSNLFWFPLILCFFVSLGSTSQPPLLFRRSSDGRTGSTGARVGSG